MAERGRVDGKALTDVTPSALGIARAYPEVVRGAVVAPPQRVLDGAPAAAPLVLPSWGRREINDREPIDLPFQFALDELELDPVRAIERARCPLGRLEVAHLPPAVCGSDAERIERRASPDELACIREALDRARVGTEATWQFCQLGELRTHERWKADYYDELFRWLRELGCPPLACETIRFLAEATGDVRAFTGCPQGTAITHRLRLGNAPGRIDDLAESIPIVECQPRVSLPRPVGPRDRGFVVERPLLADPPILVSALALERNTLGTYVYPRGCRLSGTYLPTEGVALIAAVEALPAGRSLQLRRLGARPGAPMYGRLIGTPEFVAMGSAPDRLLDPSGRNGLRAHQSTVHRDLGLALFAIVDSRPGDVRAEHFIVEAGADPTVPARVRPVLGLSDPYPSPAGIAYGRSGPTAEGQIAFAYVRHARDITTIEFGFLASELDHWSFRRTASVLAPDTVEDNVAVVYNPVAAEWAIAFVPGDYTPGAFAQRFDFFGNARAAAPTVVVYGAGDGLVGPHSGLTLAVNRRSGRYLLSVSHNLAAFEPAADGTVALIANDGSTVGPDNHDLYDRLPQNTTFSHAEVWTVAPCYVDGLEFRGGGPSAPIRMGTPTACWVCSPPGPEFYYRRAAILWPGGRGYGFLHQYLELTDSNRFMALIARDSLPDMGGELLATVIRDGPIPPL